MMFRETPDGAIAIPQPSHAWISGQLIRAWGNEAFGAVLPYEAVCLGAEQHDIGWLSWERAPTLNPAFGRPHSFREIPVSVHTALWRLGTDMAAVFGRYPALLASLHGTGLYAYFDYAAATAEDAAIARAFVAEQEAVQRRLLKSLRAEGGSGVSDAEIERNRGLVRTADRLSIAICTALRDMAVSTADPLVAVIRQVPTATATVDLRMEARTGDAAKLAVSPWPFSASSVRVSCEGSVLPPVRFDDETAMRAALRDAPKVVVAAELLPG